MQDTNRIAPGAIRALVWEFIWRLGSATMFIVSVVVIMALSFGGCANRQAEAAPPSPTPANISITVEQLTEMKAALYETTRLAEAANNSVVTLERCRDSFWQAVEQPPAAVARWDQSEHLDYLVSLVQTRDRCEDRALFRLAGQMDI
jgi:hypothetical protein